MTYVFLMYFLINFTRYAFISIKIYEIKTKKYVIVILYRKGNMNVHREYTHGFINN